MLRIVLGIVKDPAASAVILGEGKDAIVGGNIVQAESELLHLYNAEVSKQIVPADEGEGFLTKGLFP